MTSPPKSRLQRITALARTAAPLAWSHFRAGKRVVSEEAARRAAERAFASLGHMKGLALKIGQILSYVDGAVPEDHREAYHSILGRLQKDAPSLPWTEVEQVLKSELGSIGDHFRVIDPVPIAAASLGQVHRAELLSGVEVAVKVQYPGIAEALTADLDNAHALRSLIAPLFFVLGQTSAAETVNATLAELRARFLEELDYQREASMQSRFRALFLDDPEIRIPEVYSEHSTRRVLVTRFVRGRTLQEVCRSDPQHERNRYGEIINRFVIRSLHTHALFNGDPHPGNYLLPEDRTVVFLDFGCVKEIPPWMQRAMIGYFRAAVAYVRNGGEEELAQLDAELGATLRLPSDDPDACRIYRDFVLFCLKPYLKDEPFRFTRSYTAQSMSEVISGLRSSSGRLLTKLPNPPADFALMTRLQWGFYSILTMLEAESNWHRSLTPEITALAL